MRRWLTGMLLWLGLAGAMAQSAAAEPALSHVVRPGETLASIASHYYGDPRHEGVIVAENGLTSEGGSAIVVGLRLIIPTVSYHRVVEGETWPQLAEMFYGDAQRAFVLLDANGATAGTQPDTGAEIVVPYPLRHVVGQNETLQRLTKLYYPKGGGPAGALRRFNQLTVNRLTRGQIVLVPLSNLVLTREGRKALRAAFKSGPAGGDILEKQTKISAELPTLRRHVKGGHYAEAVAMANRLIGAGDLTGNQIVTIQRELATALVALGRDDLARAAFSSMLAQQPDMELDIARTSPKVLAVFESVRKGQGRSDRSAKARKKPKKRQKTIKRKVKKSKKTASAKK